MSGISVAAEWQLLHNRYYRKPQLYPLLWHPMHLPHHLLAFAPLSGPIAAIRNPSQIPQLLSQSQSLNPSLQIFSSSGLLLASSPFPPPPSPVLAVSFTPDLSLICLLQNATLLKYNIRAALSPDSPLSLGPECSQQGILASLFWGNGVVCVTRKNQVFCVPDFGAFRVCRLADAGLEECPLCVAVIEPGFTVDGGVEVLLGVGDGVVGVDEEGVRRLGVGVGAVRKMAVAPNGMYLAAFTGEGRMIVVPTDFSRVVSECWCEVRDWWMLCAFVVFFFVFRFLGCGCCWGR